MALVVTFRADSRSVGHMFRSGLPTEHAVLSAIGTDIPCRLQVCCIRVSLWVAHGTCSPPSASSLDACKLRLLLFPGLCELNL
ncbi:hypothetical protein PVK06_003603 [Gossypium arboreum]|uniref:Uncharacterized protein n=1 Tax=Gossypium arboreum TaxID=29729 RepID=A0ABR0R865_GOSAR|nr:hypothetical protein PVK06_003603 [Gossypium arboreum]